MSGTGNQKTNTKPRDVPSTHHSESYKGFTGSVPETGGRDQTWVSYSITDAHVSERGEEKRGVVGGGKEKQQPRARLHQAVF